MHTFVKVKMGAIFYAWIVEYEKDDQAKQLKKQKHDVGASGDH